MAKLEAPTRNVTPGAASPSVPPLSLTAWQPLSSASPPARALPWNSAVTFAQRSENDVWSTTSSLWQGTIPLRSLQKCIT
ncbi:MAG: hypothetical protein EHM37_06235 [Deltaproteobacteria bacterium]|jgi:hypothetical protein|nr:MAG: hypothetical protein EHM37_06235 [Deltaproteobacteria bacterium]